MFGRWRWLFGGRDEAPPPETFDLGEFRERLADQFATERELYVTQLEPYLDRLAATYGTNVPVTERDALQAFVAAKRVRIQEQIQAGVDQAAKEGKTLSLDVLRMTMEDAKRSYNGDDHEEYVAGMNRLLDALAARYGTMIPIDHAYRIMWDLEAGRGFSSD